MKWKWLSVCESALETRGCAGSPEVVARWDNGPLRHGIQAGEGVGGVALVIRLIQITIPSNLYSDHSALGHLWEDIIYDDVSVSLSRPYWRYLVCQFREVLLCIVDDIPHPEDRAVGVDHVKVALFDVIVGDGRKEVPSRWTQGRRYFLWLH